MSGKRLLLFVIISLVLLFGVFLLIGTSKDFKLNLFTQDMVEAPGEEVEDGVPTETPAPEERPVVKFETSSTEWKVNDEYELSVSFEELTEPPPTAATIHIVYNPEYVEVIDINEGDLWTGTNVLQKIIDNEKGEVMFSIGQDFSADVTGNITLANFTVKVIKSGLLSVETEFELGSESAIASVGINRLIMLQGLPIKVKLKR